MSHGRTAQVTMPRSEDEPAGSPEKTGEHEQHAEDRLTMPAAWLRALHPRRGGAKVAVPPLDPGAPERLAAKLDGLRQQVLDALEACRDPELAAAGAAYLAGEPAAAPLGAAVVVASLSWSDHELAALFAETWLVERGLAFAATAVTELASLTYEVAQDSWRVRRMASHEYHHYWYGWNRMELAARIRAVLSAASDAEYAEVVAALAASREGGLHHRVMASFLAPSETGWVMADCAEVSAVNEHLAHHLVPALSTPEQAALIVDHVRDHLVSSASLATLVDGMGVEAVPLLIGWLGQTYDADGERRLLGTLAELPSDAAMRALLDRLDQKHVQPAFLRAAARFPRRAMRLLAATGGKTADQLLRAHVLTHLDLVEEVVSGMDAGAAERITGIANAVPVATAPPEALPEVLVSPPWAKKRKTRKPTVVTGLTCADAPVLAWAPGERDNWRSSLEGGAWDRIYNETWEEVARGITDESGRRHHRYNEITLFVSGPERLAAPLIEKWRPIDQWGAGDWLPPVIARFELAALPLALDLARSNPATAGHVLLPFAAPEIAVLMADWLSRLKSARAIALAWLNRHPARAARALVPVALGKPGVPRRQAEQALTALAGAGHHDVVTRAAAGYGPAAEAAVTDLLAADPLDALPARLPALPDWTQVALLTPIHLRGDKGALPAEAVRNVMTMLAISKPGLPYAGLALVKEACDGRSLAEFAWALFQRWQAAGYPAKESWVMDALGLLGDDETVRRLTPLIKTWPRDGGHARAVAALDLLASIGSDVALMHLHGIAEKVKFSGLRSRARQKMDEVAAELGLTPQELADRLVPDFGLSPDGSMTLDYGRRSFVVGFDEQLKPYVTDAAGKRLKNLPKPGANDDPELAPAAHQRFTGLKKDVRAVASDNIRRLEQAMVTRRRWSGAEFGRLLVGHPLLWHIVRRLVWGIYDPSGELTGTLRVAEDRSFADVEDDPLPLPADALVGVAHPLELGESLAAWSEVFADYEILQPFPQLGRETYENDPALIAEIEAAKIPAGAVIGLERRGWRRGAPQDAGIQYWIERDVPGGRTVTIGFEPGFAIGYAGYEEEQSLVGVSVDGLDPVTASEILRDLREITR
ncbi:DUF4132 domain-containing protein [Nonomuraea sp. FMUSA5-5]|uniref:DUF4132 domain-containing protein n=1 Tax=Nonomuraea composti TaxID=2720023 RepID=A0ABX1BIT5_9ACTN|nr:DUF4132 domain-containing protein [Nonomuraea sp. FMUSA5-5]NJP97645.1 DUF4132 domain-containing protein [Nonomuraea sp. FMUSA5-5]